MPTFKEITSFTYNGNPSGTELIQISSSQSCNLQDIADLAVNTKYTGSGQSIPYFTRAYGGSTTAISSSLNLNVYPGNIYRVTGNYSSGTVTIKYYSNLTSGGYQDYWLLPSQIWISSTAIGHINFVKGSSVGDGRAMSFVINPDWKVVPSGASYSLIIMQALPANYPWVFINVQHYTTSI